MIREHKERSITIPYWDVINLGEEKLKTFSDYDDIIHSHRNEDGERELKLEHGFSDVCLPLKSAFKILAFYQGCSTILDLALNHVHKAANKDSRRYQCFTRSAGQRLP